MSIEPAEQPIPADESEPSRPPEGGPTDADTRPLLAGNVKIADSSRYSQPAAKGLRDSTKISVASGSP